MSRPETCDRCKQEVRYGTRDGVTGWLHRFDVDHMPRFGTPGPTPAEAAEIRQAAHERLGIPDPDLEENRPVIVIPDPEVRALRITAAPKQVRLFLAGPEGTRVLDIPGGLRTVLNAARPAGWDHQITYARGPWLHATRWEPTGIVDHYLLRLSRGDDRASATWRDGKLESAWWWTEPKRNVEPVDSKTLRERIKA